LTVWPAGQKNDSGSLCDDSAVSRLRALVFPVRPRSLPGRRGIKISLRAVHALCAGVLVGGLLLAVEPDRVGPWIAGTAISGLAILLLDLHESGAFLVQIRGVVVLGKIVLLASMPWLGASRPGLLAAVLLISVVSSHAPSKVRYLLVIGRRSISGSRSKG
jgi:hypothetical protein